MKLVPVTGAVAALMGLCSVSDAADVPSQLYNKTIALSYTVSHNGVDENGKGSLPRLVNLTAYISSQGRIFPRWDANAGRFSQRQEIAPASVTFHFEAGRLVSAFKGGFSSGGASLMTISFDPGFQGCTASVQIGRDNSGVYKWTSMDGRKMTATSVTASTPTCSIRDGNPFAK